jgi:hypothetical protein
MFFEKKAPALDSGASSARRREHMVSPTRFGCPLRGAPTTRRRLTRGGGGLRRILPVRPAHPLLTRLLGPSLTSLLRQILTATASLRSLRLQDHRA